MSQSRHERDAYREAVLEQRAREAGRLRLDPEDWRRWATPAELARDAERRAAAESPKETLF